MSWCKTCGREYELGLSNGEVLFALAHTDGSRVLSESNTCETHGCPANARCDEWKRSLNGDQQ